MMKEKGQLWLRLDGDNNWQIIIPDWDLKPHANKFIKKGQMELAWLDCPCKPKVQFEDKIIVHNSFLQKQKVDESIKALG